MQYTVLVYESEADFTARSDETRKAAYWGAYRAYTMIEEAERELADASRRRRPGRFQLEAAIQSAHACRAITGHTDWEAIALLYAGLLHHAAAIGALVGHAAAVAEARGPAAGFVAIEAIPVTAVEVYQPYWALRARLLKARGRSGEAAGAYARAVALSEDAAVREFLLNEASR